MPVAHYQKFEAVKIEYEKAKIVMAIGPGGILVIEKATQLKRCRGDRHIKEAKVDRRNALRTPLQPPMVSRFR